MNTFHNKFLFFIGLMVFITGPLAAQVDSVFSQFVGTVDLDNFVAGGTGDVVGDLNDFSDQTNQYFASDIAVGDIVWDNQGNRWRVDVVNSSNLISANVDLTQLNASGATPFGRGFVTRESPTIGLSGFPPDNSTGISQQLKSRVETHNTLKLDKYLRDSLATKIGLDSLTQDGRTFTFHAGDSTYTMNSVDTFFIENGVNKIVVGTDTLTARISTNGQTLYVSTSGNNSTAEKGDIFSPWRDPFSATKAAQNGDIIEVLDADTLAFVYHPSVMGVDQHLPSGFLQDTFWYSDAFKAIPDSLTFFQGKSLTYRFPENYMILLAHNYSGFSYSDTTTLFQDIDSISGAILGGLKVRPLNADWFSDFYSDATTTEIVFEFSDFRESQYSFMEEGKYTFKIDNILRYRTNDGIVDWGTYFAKSAKVSYNVGESDFMGYFDLALYPGSFFTMNVESIGTWHGGFDVGRSNLSGDSPINYSVTIGAVDSILGYSDVGIIDGFIQSNQSTVDSIYFNIDIGKADVYNTILANLNAGSATNILSINCQDCKYYKDGTSQYWDVRYEERLGILYQTSGNTKVRFSGKHTMIDDSIALVSVSGSMNLDVQNAYIDAGPNSLLVDAYNLGPGSSDTYIRITNSTFLTDADSLITYDRTEIDTIYVGGFYTNNTKVTSGIVWVKEEEPGSNAIGDRLQLGNYTIDENSSSLRLDTLNQFVVVTENSQALQSLGGGITLTATAGNITFNGGTSGEIIAQGDSLNTPIIPYSSGGLQEDGMQGVFVENDAGEMRVSGRLLPQTILDTITTANDTIRLGYRFKSAVIIDMSSAPATVTLEVEQGAWGASMHIVFTNVGGSHTINFSHEDAYGNSPSSFALSTSGPNNAWAFENVAGVWIANYNSSP